jgi:glycosyltransferase involved in cell wall biosynthesis
LKLVFISPTYPLRGGIARYGTHLLTNLQKHHDCLGIGYKKLYPRILFPGQSQFETEPPPISDYQAEAILHYGRWSTWREALRKIRAFAPEGVVIAWWVTFWAPHLGWLSRKLSRKIPVLFLCHNVLPHEVRRPDPELVRWALRPGRGFITHSEEDRRRLLDFFPAANVRRCEHPLYSSDELNLPTRAEARRILGVSGRMLLFFGFVRPYKGVDTAIEALSLLGDAYRDIMLWIAGEFWEDVRCYHQQIERLKLQDRVRIESGYLPESELLLRLSACDGVVLPYRSATGSGALATAFAARRPVIATRCGCFREMVTPDVSGLLCEPGDAGSLACAIEAFYSGAGPERFDAGVAQARRKFSWDGILHAIEELVRNE